MNAEPGYQKHTSNVRDVASHLSRLGIFSLQRLLLITLCMYIARVPTLRHTCLCKV